LASYPGNEIGEKETENSKDPDKIRARRITATSSKTLERRPWNERLNEEVVLTDSLKDEVLRERNVKGGKGPIEGEAERRWGEGKGLRLAKRI